MNEDRKKRGIKNHKILMTVAICALFLGSSNTFAARSTSAVAADKRLAVELVVPAVASAFAAYCC